MLYKNVNFLTSEFTFEIKDVCVCDGEICAAAEGEQSTEATGCYIVPALTDIHTHGALGVSANDASYDAYDTLCHHMESHGIYGFLPTVITDDADAMADVCAMFSRYVKSGKKSSYGLYLEGPFINVSKKGAHNQKYILSPDIRLFRKMYDRSEGQIRMITVAPELPGAIDFISEAANLCRVAIGHSAADYDTVMRAFDAGASCVTHLFNAMNPLGHRAPGIVAAAMDSGAYVELICDGKHIHPSVIRMVFSAFDKDRIVFISDAISATGLEDGVYELGGLKTIVKDGTSTLEDGTLAGSTTDLLSCVRNATRFGISIEDALRAASLNPCRLIGRSNKCVIVLDKNLEFIA